MEFTKEDGKKSSSRPSHRHQNFPFGNYPSYYNYRNSDKDGLDPRLTRIDSALAHNVAQDLEFPYSSLYSLVRGKKCIDIGCNTGKVTIDIAEEYKPRWILGVDIDHKLIERARQRQCTCSHLVRFACENWIDSPSDAPILNEYDLVFCLSITKWIHLNWGDEGISKLFSRIYNCLAPTGILILEPQEFETYKRKKNLSLQIANNYQTLQLKPESFVEYLETQGYFKLVLQVDVPAETTKGFSRPIYLLQKLSNTK